jgi:hypothetical protein
LKGKPSVGFYNIGVAEEAKEKLLKGPAPTTSTVTAAFTSSAKTGKGKPAISQH